MVGNPNGHSPGHSSQWNVTNKFPRNLTLTEIRPSPPSLSRWQHHVFFRLTFYCLNSGSHRLNQSIVGHWRNIKWWPSDGGDVKASTYLMGPVSKIYDTIIRLDVHITRWNVALCNIHYMSHSPLMSTGTYKTILDGDKASPGQSPNNIPPRLDWSSRGLVGNLFTKTTDFSPY